MIGIEFRDDVNGRIVKGILLGKYHRTLKETYSYEKKFLWIRKTVKASRTVDSSFYIIFIPWKHELKEIQLVEEKYIVHSPFLHPEENWVTKEKFISETYDGDIYPFRYEIKNFSGYGFIYENNSFIADLCFCNFDQCISILYENMPEVLELDLGNIEA